VALVEKDREHLDDARRHLDEVLLEMDASGTKDGLGRVLFSSAELALRMNDVERATRDTARSAALAVELADRYDEGRLRSVEARIAHGAGRPMEADRLFEEGIRQLSDIGALYDLGRCYYEWGVRTDDRPKASARLGTAARLFERIGARRELERTRGVLERIATRITADAPAGASSEGIIGLYEVSKIVNSTKDLSAVLDAIVDLALKRLNAERGMVLLTDPVTSRVSLRVARNLKTGREEEAEAISRSVVDRVVTEGKSILAADARVDPRFVGRESILAHSIVSFLCVPLRVKDRISGAIYVDHRTSARLFSEADRAFLEAFADLAAVAIENARLVEELLEARLRLSVENESLKANLARGSSLDNLVGRSEAASRIKKTLPRAAAGNVTVLIRGESGTGKNLCARILHSLSARANGPFIQFNCAALPDTLAESELFGHEKGSFTGADRRKPGRFELANGGTIFLDEIGKTTLSIQAKLLRVVEDKEYERVGGTVTLKTDAKILAATNLDIEAAIKRGEFREDLFYRLNVVPIELPSLRQRLDDLPGLVEHFVVKLSRDLGTDPRRLDPAILKLFARYPWPGNIRELEATLHRALVLTPGEALEVKDFPWILESPLLTETGARLVEAASSASPVDLPGTPLDPETYERILATVERDLIERALGESNGKIREAARRLGLARNTLKAKMGKYGLRGQDEVAS
jgi:Nif-specific regulatory protein